MTNQIDKLLNSGSNCLITGPAGTGKTYSIAQYVKNSKRNIAICATTGAASLVMGGETIHRFLKLGINTRPELADKIINKWEKIKQSTKSWDKRLWQTMKNLDAIVIDEASMLRRDQFELVDVVLSSIYDDPRPFGGIQIILVGDFYQLPPVVSSYDVVKFKDLKKPYCFQSYLWKNANFQTINLTKNYRQDDPIFLEALNKIRIGIVDEKTDTLMKACANTDFQGLNPVRLFPLKIDVARENFEQLKSLNQKLFVSEASYKGKEYDIEILKKECPAEDKLYFCKNAQIVMLTNDFEGRWVNGSIGIIQTTDPLVIKLYNGNTIRPAENTWERVEYKVDINNKLEAHTIAEMEQLPFKLSWAVSTHKSQGSTLDCVDVDLESTFAYGQAYVALSRVKTLKGLRIRGWSKEVVKVDPMVKEFYDRENI